MLDGGESSGNQQKLEVFGTQLFNNDIIKRNAKKGRDRKIHKCKECSYYTHRRNNLTCHMRVCNNCCLVYLAYLNPIILIIFNSYFLAMF